MIDPLAAALVALYFILMVGIGVWASKKIACMSDYVVAGRSLNFWVFTMLMIGSVCSGMSLLGVSGLGFKFAWPTIWEQLAVPALDRVLYHILWCQDARGCPEIRVHDRPGLLCAPV